MCTVKVDLRFTTTMHLVPSSAMSHALFAHLRQLFTGKSPKAPEFPHFHSGLAARAASELRNPHSHAGYTAPEIAVARVSKYQTAVLRLSRKGPRAKATGSADRSAPACLCRAFGCLSSKGPAIFHRKPQHTLYRFFIRRIHHGPQICTSALGPNRRRIVHSATS